MIRFYFGIHTEEKKADGEPIHQYEESYDLNTSFKGGMVILRGLIIYFIKIVGLKEEHELK